MSEPQAPVVAPTELLAVLIDLCEAIDAYQSAREELQKCEDGSLDEQEAIDFALGQWKTVLELRKAVSANAPHQARAIASRPECGCSASSIGGKDNG
jgi:hypothetical protein